MGGCAIMAGVPLVICETFERQTLHPLLKWFNPPASWHADPARSRLLVESSGETDFWQRTHYGFRADNGHLLYAEVTGDGTLSATIFASPTHQYDQAGLMVRVSEDCWLKASVEYETDKPCQLGTVVTNHGFSDWSLQDLPATDVLSYCLRIRWQGNDFLVDHAQAQAGPWHSMRVTHLFREPAAPLLCGIYACSPKGPGFPAEFASLRIEEEGEALPETH